MQRNGWVMGHCVAGKRNHHLGPADIYLDDLTTLDPEVAVLYFPKRYKSRTYGSHFRPLKYNAFLNKNSPISLFCFCPAVRLNHLLSTRAPSQAASLPSLWAAGPWTVEQSICQIPTLTTWT